MRKFMCFFTITLILFSTNLFASEVFPDVASYKYNKFKNLTIAGFAMVILGAPLLLSGIIMAGNGEWETVKTSTGVKKRAIDGNAKYGVFGICLGGPFTLTGIILGSIGIYKQKQYESYLNNASLDIKLSPKKQGVYLSYKF